jgi:hypothetical protein
MRATLDLLVYTVAYAMHHFYLILSITLSSPYTTSVSRCRHESVLYT